METLEVILQKTRLRGCVMSGLAYSERTTAEDRDKHRGQNRIGTWR